MQWDLARLLRPEYRSVDVLPSALYAADEFRFFIRFDGRGNEVEREFGYGAGSLRI
jgi:hypothetical protein